MIANPTGATPPTASNLSPMHPFRSGHAAGGDWRTLSRAVLAQLDPLPPGANIGFVYATDLLAGAFGDIAAALAGETGIGAWAGTVGLGICATGQEYFDEPAIAAMVGSVPDDSFAHFKVDQSGLTMAAGRDDWLGRTDHPFGIIHCDPRNPHIPVLLQKFAGSVDGFMVGGLTSSRTTFAQVAGSPTEGGISGVLFSDRVPVATGLTQGCAPLGASHEVTSCERNVAITLDGRPALDVFCDDIGVVDEPDLGSVGGAIFAALPIQGSDRADYLVRNIVGLDTERGSVSIGELLESGQALMFCRRDPEAARHDLTRMLRDLMERGAGAPKAAVYISCLGRGPNTFGTGSAELKAIQHEIGEVPLVGFFGNGEISHDRLYTYTGVLTLFL
jgi:small ligand-binding sensory domain FIST